MFGGRFRQNRGSLNTGSILRRLTLILIRGYQYLISPVLIPSCRFYPSCSHYAYEAISRYGVLNGLLLAVKRILKCHPFHPGGIDPVPPNLSRKYK